MHIFTAEVYIFTAEVYLPITDEVGMSLTLVSGGKSVLHEDNDKHNEVKSPHLNLQSYNLLHNQHIRFTLLSCNIIKANILKHFTTIHKGWNLPHLWGWVILNDPSHTYLLQGPCIKKCTAN